jgi:hypothetical protein
MIFWRNCTQYEDIRFVFFQRFVSSWKLQYLNLRYTYLVSVSSTKYYARIFPLTFTSSRTFSRKIIRLKFPEVKTENTFGALPPYSFNPISLFNRILILKMTRVSLCVRCTVYKAQKIKDHLAHPSPSITEGDTINYSNYVLVGRILLKVNDKIDHPSMRDCPYRNSRIVHMISFCPLPLPFSVTMFILNRGSINGTQFFARPNILIISLEQKNGPRGALPRGVMIRGEIWLFVR